jgi:hypothetical protein
MSIEFVSTLSGAAWTLTNVYAPCNSEGRQQFLEWFNGIDMPEETDWLLVGDFNLIRRQSDRNKPGGNTQDMLDFNVAISNLRLEELRLHDSRYTWSSKQASPLLERLDWFFASVSWMANYPGTLVSTLSRDTSDHMPCLISISTDVPKAKVFHFENYWMMHEDFMQVMQHGWRIHTQEEDKAKRLGAKFKNLRRVLKAWHNQLASLAKTIGSNRMALFLLDYLEEHRDLSLEEWNFRLIIQGNIAALLEQQRIY